MPRRKNAPCGRQPDDPSPEEIEAFCKSLQATWSPREEARRRGKRWYDDGGVELRTVREWDGAE